MKLREIQENFKDTILDPQLLDADDDAFRAIFKTGAGPGIESRMKVYRNNVIRSLTDAAIAPLALCQKLVGKAFLEQAVRSCVVKNLPQEGNLNLYGITFPEFLKSYLPAKDMPYLADLARLEWAFEQAYYAPDDVPLPVEELDKIAEDKLPDLRFTFRSSFKLVESPWPLDEIVDFCRMPEAPENFDIIPGETAIMVLRPELNVELHKLKADEALLLKGLQKNVKLGQVAETILRSHPNFDLGTLLQKHFVLGTFAGFTI